MTSRADLADALDRFAAAAYRQRAAAASTRPNVNAADLLALSIIRRADRISPGSLARALVYTSSGAEDVIRRIVSAGLADRVIDPDDHRQVSLVVTDAGAALTTGGAGGWDPEFLERGTRLRADVMGNLMGLLTAASDAAEARADRLAEQGQRLRVRDLPDVLRWG